MRNKQTQQAIENRYLNNQLYYKTHKHIHTHTHTHIPAILSPLSIQQNTSGCKRTLKNKNEIKFVAYKLPREPHRSIRLLQLSNR